MTHVWPWAKRLLQYFDLRLKMAPISLIFVTIPQNTYKYAFESDSLLAFVTLTPSGRLLPDTDPHVDMPDILMKKSCKWAFTFGPLRKMVGFDDLLT